MSLGEIERCQSQIEDRMKLWSSKTTVELRQKSIMYNLLDKSWETGLDQWRESEVPIPVINWDTSVYAVYACAGCGLGRQ